jgi:hypothetical protein
LRDKENTRKSVEIAHLKLGLEPSPEFLPENFQRTIPVGENIYERASDFV